MAVNVIKWKSDSPVSITHVVWKLGGTLTGIKTMHVQWDEFLQYVGCFVRLARLKLPHKVFMFYSSTSTLAKINTFSYVEEYEFKKSLNSMRWFPILLLQGM